MNMLFKKTRAALKNEVLQYKKDILTFVKEYKGRQWGKQFKELHKRTWPYVESYKDFKDNVDLFDKTSIHTYLRHFHKRKMAEGRKWTVK
jgi:hypothetical protein